jgi:PTS system sucrose-specific IIC component
VISFTLTWFVWKEETEEEQGTEPKKQETGSTTPAPVLSADGNILYAPIKGNVISRENIPDETFASGVLGDGVGIEPEIGEVVAPFDGEISTVTDTKHAVGISGPKDMEVLIHVGIDTVNMNGDGFELLVKAGDKVKAGQKLLTFDISKIKAAGYSTTTAVLLTNSDDFPDLKVLKNGKTNCMEELLAVE